MIYKYIDIENQELISQKVYDYVVNRTSILQGNPKQVWNNLDTEDFLNRVPEFTKFFEVDEKYIEKRDDNEGEKYAHITNTEEARLLESVELIKPIVFKPCIPHGIWTNPTCEEPRLTLTIAFNKSLEYMLK